MDIKNLRPDALPARPAAPITPVREDSRHAPAASEKPVDQSDRVEISEDARFRAEMGASDVPSGTLPADRLLELRRRIQERAHDSAEVADAVMDRLVRDGEI